MVDWYIWAVIVALVAIAVYYYNKIVVLKNRIENSWAQIDVQLKKRADLVPNLVETVKGYMKHERMMTASGIPDKVKAGGELAGALKTILALAENYPNLKASENFLMLQEELSGIENKIAYSRQFYNDSVLEFNNTVSTIPGVWFAGPMGKTSHDYLQIAEEERKPVKVEF